MLPERGIRILLNEAVSTNLGLTRLQRNFGYETNGDRELLKLAFDLGLNLYFYDINNYTLDYALAGHVALLTDRDIIVLALPAHLSEGQWEEMHKLKKELTQKHLFIYSFEKKNTIENLHLFYQPDETVSNEVLIDQVLSSKTHGNFSIKSWQKIKDYDGSSI